MDKYVSAQARFYDKKSTDKSYLTSVWNCIKNHVHGKVLDIGGGDGALLDFYDAVPENKFILDIAPKALKRAKKKGYKTTKGDMHKLSYKKTFDTVLIINTFEHSDTPRKLLKRIRQALKPKGVLIIEVPNAMSIRQITNLIIKESPLPSGNSPLHASTPHHMFQYTPKILRTFANEEFSTVEIIYKPPVNKIFNLIFKIMPKWVKQRMATDIIAICRK